MIGVQMFTVRNHCKTPEALYESLTKLYSMGYRAFELAYISFSEAELDVLKRFKEENNIIYSTSQITLKKILKDFDWMVMFSKTLDIQSIEMSVIPMKAFLKGKRGLLELANTLNEVGKRLKAEGLDFLYHHHNYELVSYNNQLGLSLLMDHTDLKYVNFVCDTYWLARSGINPGTFIKDHINRVSGIHLRDCTMTYRKFAFKFSDGSVGSGTVDFSFIRTLDEVFLSVEQATSKPFKGLEASLNYLKSHQYI